MCAVKHVAHEFALPLFLYEGEHLLLLWINGAICHTRYTNVIQLSLKAR